MNRIWNVVRVHNANRFTFLAAPWVIVALALAVALIPWIITRVVTGAEFTLSIGGPFVLLAFQLVIAVQGVAGTFPFALGYSVSRREFAVGTGVLFVLLAAGHAVLFTVLSYLEEATGGWGLGGTFFRTAWTSETDPLSRWFIVFAAQVLCFAIGGLAAAIWVRWRTLGVTLAGTAVFALSFASAAYLGMTGGWMEVGAWMAATGVVGMLAWSLVVAALLAAIGFVVLRRATAR